MRNRLAAACALGIAGLVGCRHAGPVTTPLPGDWMSLRAPVASFASLHRLSCCGRRGLLAALRVDAQHLSLTVTAPPGKVVLEAWVQDGVGNLHDREASCRVRLDADELPITDAVSVPLDVSLLAAMLSGTVSESARALPEAPGWVEWESQGSWVRANISSPGPRVVAIRTGRAGEAGTRLVATLGEHRGVVPGAVALEAGGKRARLELITHRVAGPPQAPPWLAETLCVEAP